MTTGETSPLKSLRRAFQSTLKLPPDDSHLSDYLLALFLANQMKTVADPVWGWLAGPPGSGKNEAMRVFADHPNTYFISEVTENALMSGYVDDDDPDRDPSLLPLLDGRTMVVEDTSGLLKMRETAIDSLMGTLRNLYGGEQQTKASGSAGQRSYKSRFGILFGATGLIDTIQGKHSQLGERFITFRICRRTARHPLSARMKTLDHVFASMAGKKEWRQRLKTIGHDALNAAIAHITREGETIAMDDATRTQLFFLADLVARLRTVPVGNMPTDPEPGTRLIQQFVTLGTARALADHRTTWEPQDTWFVQRLAADTLPRWVVELLCQLSPVVVEDESPRPALPYLRVRNAITAIDPQTLQTYIRQFRHIRFLTPGSGTTYESDVQLSEEGLYQLRYCGLLYGERGPEGF